MDGNGDMQDMHGDTHDLSPFTDAADLLDMGFEECSFFPSSGCFVMGSSFEMTKLQSDRV